MISVSKRISRHGDDCTSERLLLRTVNDTNDFPYDSNYNAMKSEPFVLPIMLEENTFGHVIHTVRAWTYPCSRFLLFVLCSIVSSLTAACRCLPVSISLLLPLCTQWGELSCGTTRYGKPTREKERVGVCECRLLANSPQNHLHCSVSVTYVTLGAAITLRTDRAMITQWRQTAEHRLLYIGHCQNNANITRLGSADSARE